MRTPEEMDILADASRKSAIENLCQATKMEPEFAAAIVEDIAALAVLTISSAHLRAALNVTSVGNGME